jgi:short-subunit dehydrogenase
MLYNRYVSLTLGATSGLGQQISRLCLEDEYHVVEVGSSIRKLETTAQITEIPCDLKNIESVQKLLNTLESKKIFIDRFFWVAGQLIKGEFANQGDEEILNTIDVNFRNSVLIAHYVWKQMQVAQTKCDFVVIASSSGIKPRSDEAIYVATKHAQVGFTQSLGLENKNPNVKVSLFLPGGMQTPFWDKNPTPHYNTFLDPKKVAEKIISSITLQEDSFQQIEIPRGSL